MKRWIVGFAMLIATVGAGQAKAAIGVYHPGKPDYDQKADPKWGNYFCGPVAAANSLYWLSQKYPALSGLTKDKNRETLIEALAADMGATQDTDGNWQWPDGNPGTTIQSFIDGKLSYIHNNGGGVIQKTKVGKLRVSKSDTLTAGGHTYRRITSASGDFPTLDWIKSARARGEDVEIGLMSAIKKDGKWYVGGGHLLTVRGGGDEEDFAVPGHFVTLAGYGEPFTDANSNDFWDEGEPWVELLGNGDYDSDILAIHDPLADGVGNPLYSRTFTDTFFGESSAVSDDFYEVFEETINPRLAFMKLNRQRDGYELYALIDVAVSESPIPEPSTLIIWSLLGALGITVGWWRRTRAG